MEAKRKLFVQMSGAPGSGKSTLANLLARHSSINGVVINHDLIKSFFLDSSSSFQSSAALAYDFQWVLARDLLKQGQTVVIDSTCNFTKTLDQGIALAREYECQYTYIECKMSVNDLDLLETRLCSRVALRSQRTSVEAEPTDAATTTTTTSAADLTIPQDPLARFKTWIESPVRPSITSDAVVVIAVDSVSSPADCLDSALQQLGLFPV